MTRRGFFKRTIGIVVAAIAAPTARSSGWHVGRDCAYNIIAPVRIPIPGTYGAIERSTEVWFRGGRRGGKSATPLTYEMMERFVNETRLAR